MTWELLAIKPHPHRGGGEDGMVFMRKSIRRSEREGVNAIQFAVDLFPLPLLVGKGSEKQLVPIEHACFRVVADITDRKLLFDIGSADSALPSLLRGSGLGSLAISELVIWSKQYHSDFSIVPSLVSASILNYPNAKTNAIRCLENFGFAIGKPTGTGLSFGAESCVKLAPHVNSSKVEQVNPVIWSTQSIQDKLKLSDQLVEQSQDLMSLREQLFQLSNTRKSSVPFISGLLAGAVAGTVIAALLFSI